jgi:hypothetical protein
MNSYDMHVPSSSYDMRSLNAGSRDVLVYIRKRLHVPGSEEGKESEPFGAWLRRMSTWRKATL